MSALEDPGERGDPYPPTSVVSLLFFGVEDYMTLLPTYPVSPLPILV
jgi:hypothetical protein